MSNRDAGHYEQTASYPAVPPCINSIEVNVVKRASVSAPWCQLWRLVAKRVQMHSLTIGSKARCQLKAVW